MKNKTSKTNTSSNDNSSNDNSSNENKTEVTSNTNVNANVITDNYYEVAVNGSNKISGIYEEVLFDVVKRMKDNPFTYDMSQMCGTVLADKKKKLSEVQEELSKTNENNLTRSVLMNYEKQLTMDINRMQRQFDILFVVDKYILPPFRNEFEAVNSKQNQ